MAVVPSKRPCRFCGHWFRPDPRLGSRQYACLSPDCQRCRRDANQASWISRHPSYFRGRAEKHRAYRLAHPDQKRLWRESHPEICERERLAQKRRRESARVRRVVAQEVLKLQLVDEKGLQSPPAPVVEQESITPQTLILIGLASQLSPVGAQEPIAGALSGWEDRGRRILGGLESYACEKAAVPAPSR